MSNNDEFNPAVFAFGTVKGHRAGGKIGGGSLDTTKRFILDILDEDDWTPRKKIMKEIDLSDPAIRRHLREMEDSGHIRSRDRGRQKEYLKL